MTSTTCRSCGSDNLEVVLSLGSTPLANALLSEDHLMLQEARYPLDLAFCHDCTLVQITETVSPAELFGEYLYFSSYSDTMVRHAETLVEQLIPERGLGPRSLVIEIASNDGYLLQFYRRQGIPVLGIEPARNIARAAQAGGIPTLCEFFGPELGQSLSARGQQADVLHAHNVLAHVADLNGVVSGTAAVLKDSGIAIIEVPYVKDLIDRCEFDTIYHEHLCYFSLTALDRLFRRHGLHVQNVERLPIHGGTLRTYAVKKSAAVKQSRSLAVDGLLKEEAARGLGDYEYY